MQSTISLRERRAREKTMPVLNREYRDILVGRGYGEQLRSFLRDSGVPSQPLEESFCDIIELAGEPNLDHVAKLIDDWVAGKDFSK